MHKLSIKLKRKKNHIQYNIKIYFFLILYKPESYKTTSIAVIAAAADGSLFKCFGKDRCAHTLNAIVPKRNYTFFIY